MGRIVVISREEHGDKFWRRPEKFDFARGVTHIPILLEEVGRSVLSFPLVFVKQGENFFFSALLGLMPGENLFLADDGRWLGNYVPALIRAYPFLLLRTDENKLALAIDEDHLSDGEGVPLFEGETFSKETQEVLRFLIEIERGKMVTANACRRLSELDLLEPWNIRIRTQGGETSIEGVFKVNENRLNSLSEEEFMSLRKIGALPLIYGQLFSMGNLSLLGKLAQMKYRAKPKEDFKADVEEIFKNLKFPKE